MAVVGLALRLREASTTYFNPDEVVLAMYGDPASGLRGVAGDHPPLFGGVMRVVSWIGESEFALRLLPVLAEAVVPILVFVWIGRLWSPRSGLMAAAVMTLSPNLVSLGAQVRGYTLLLLVAAAALVVLETALARRSTVYLLAFTGLLYLAILTEYSAAWFAAAAGVYVLLRARDVPGRWLAVWSVGQVGALALYGWLMAGTPAVTAEVMAPWSGGFPGADQSALVFAAGGVAKQFAYVFSSIPAGMVAVGLFGIGLAWMWTGGSRPDRGLSRAHIGLVVVPFLIACSAALLFLHPFGRTRHNVVLALFMLPPVAITVDSMLRSRTSLTIAAVLLVPPWLWLAEPDQNNIALDRHHRMSLLAAAEYLRTDLPAGALVLTDFETGLMLRYYLTGIGAVDAESVSDDLHRARLGGVRVAWTESWDFGRVDDLPGLLEEVRRSFALDATESIWVADGGFDIGIHARLAGESPPIAVSDLRDFDGALVVFRVPPPVEVDAGSAAPGDSQPGPGGPVPARVLQGPAWIHQPG